MNHSATSQLQALIYQDDSQNYAQAFAQQPGFVWLDSGPGRAHGGRYDIITALPLHQFQVFANGESRLDDHITTQALSQWQKTELEQFANSSADLPFIGGLLGSVDYDYGQYSCGVKAQGRPVLQIGVYTWALIQDHQEHRAWLYFSNRCSEAFRAQILAFLKQPIRALDAFTSSTFTADTDHQSYLAQLGKIAAYIRAGDVYQVNFTQRFTAQFKGDSFAAYCSLRKASPSPYGAYLSAVNGAVLSLSPERFIGIQQGHAVTQPIKGTIKRGLSDYEDQQLAQQLLASEKNRAENLMIVDLLRNDFSKNCQPFSVTTPELFTLKTYANVHHLVSLVQGKLKAEISPWQFFKDCFPGGSITGAPKKRAMEIIAELENCPRNIYCGSIFYWSANGQFDSSITIRTLLIEADNIHVWGGGGIVADSDAAEEYAESLQKIQILINALGKASTRNGL